VEAAVRAGEFKGGADGIIRGTTEVQGARVGFQGRIIGDEIRISTVFAKR
jgi:hypothetical protein